MNRRTGAYCQLWDYIVSNEHTNDEDMIHRCHEAFIAAVPEAVLDLKIATEEESRGIQH